MSAYRERAPPPLKFPFKSPNSNEGPTVSSSSASAKPPNSSTSASSHSLHNGSHTTPNSRVSPIMDADYDYKATSPSLSPSSTPSRNNATNNNNDKAAFDGEDALLDLAQLEELHMEAEKMKALGNKHMAAQEYTKAYNAYSAALQLSPVGPSSHVFLSNRAAALLSLKRYQAAATDARRSVALAPTFGKAHARLGQALYFLKDYAGAVLAYEDAIRYEPDNQVTRTYLEKAKAKLEKRNKQQQLHPQQDVMSNASVSTTPHSMAAASVVTSDPHNTGIITSSYKNASSQPALATVVAAKALHMSSTTTTTPAVSKTRTAVPPTTSTTTTTTTSTPKNNAEPVNTAVAVTSNLSITDDPDLEEALRIQHRANMYLAQKEYTAAIEEYTAALFLIPDDPILSPNLHLGRAHALNGSRRHERAKNDAIMAIRLQPNSPAAYSTLAKSLFYLKDYRGSVEAFEKCVELLPPGERLGMFDQAYLRKAEAAVEEEEASLQRAGLVHEGYPPHHPEYHHTPGGGGGGGSVKSSSATHFSSSLSVVPKLPPPRFVPREQALQATPNIPPMPKEWPQQHHKSSTSSSINNNHNSNAAGYCFKCGPERPVLFLSESLGIKLNRGPDGIVRVLWVATEELGSPIARQGHIGVGFVVWEAAGVDLRRPITNVMWGDTVALIKMAPRPIAFTVAQELSEVPFAVLEEMKRAHGGQLPKSLLSRSSSSPSVPSLNHHYNHSNNVSSPTLTLSPSQASGDEAVAPAVVSAEEDARIEEVLLETSQPPPAPSPPQSFESTNNDNDDAPSCPTPTTVAVTELLENIVDQAIQTVRDKADKAPEHNVPAIQDQSAQPQHDPVAIAKEEDPTAGAGTTTILTTNQDCSASSSLNSTSESGSAAGVEAATSQREDLSTVNKESGETGDLAVQPESLNVAGGADKSSDEPVSPPSPPPPVLTASTSLRLEEDRVLDGEILFQRLVPPPLSYDGWDNLRWLSLSGERQVGVAQPCYRLVENTENRKGLSFWSMMGHRGDPVFSYEPRCLAVYREPPLILILRRPINLAEVNEILGLPVVAELGDQADCSSTMNKYWLVESLVDPVFCKLRLSPLTTVSSLPPCKDADDRRRSCFELITPHESIYLSSVRVREEAKRRAERSFADSAALMETSVSETALIKSLCSAHERQVQGLGAISADIAWKHQFILGTFHSYVVSADVKALDEAIQTAKIKAMGAGSGDAARVLSKAIDELDDNGLTPLYYACLRRMSHAATSLVGAGANFAFRAGNMNTSLAHICARNLDHKCLSVILSAATTPAEGGSIANAADELGRTPMYLAVTEGTTASGGSDTIALSRCIQALEAWGGQLFLRDPAKPLQHPVSLLAGMWSPEELSVVLDHTPVRYPLVSSLPSASEHDNGDNHFCEEEDAIGMSLSALYQYPVHRAVSALKTYVDSTAMEDELAYPESRLVRTLRLLLEHSFEPNERLDVDENDICWSDEFVGFTPLQILASVALSVEEENQENDNAFVSIGRRRLLIHEAAEFLVRNGARISIDSPPTRRLRRSVSGSSIKRGSTFDGVLSPAEQARIAMSKLKLDSKEVLQLLGGEERLKKAQKEWAELRSVEATSKVRLSTSDKTSFSDNDAPGGNSDKSCAICWSEFGTVLNRKHRCRVTCRFVCDACSGKRLILHGAEYRVTDGQFLLARIDAAKERADRALAKAKADEERACASEETRSRARIERLEAEEQVNRDSLFGGLVEQATNFVFGEEVDKDSSKDSRKIEGLAASMNETRNALLERGDKLSSLGMKSSQMVDASSDFARMAKELRKKTESQGLFW